MHTVHGRKVRLFAALAIAATAMMVITSAAAAAPDAKKYDERLGVLTVTSFEMSTRWVALTFDAGPNRGATEHILFILRSEGVHASFAITGVWAQNNPDLVRQMVRDGHTLINRGWDGTSFTKLTSDQRRQQLTRTENTIRDIAGIELQVFFRPPAGEYDDATLTDLKAEGYVTNVLWSIDSLGWQAGDPSDIAHRVSDNVVPGSIVLMTVDDVSHDVYALTLMIDHLRDQGYRFGTLSDFILGSLLPMRYFPQTGLWVKDNILAYWDKYGGLAVFGYPINSATVKGDATVQYFERARFEYRPGSWPARYDVLLGRLGAELTAGRVNETPFKPIYAVSDQNCTFFSETSHRVCYGFRDWWNLHGGLAIFGYPISEEFTENGYTVQYFERARFEWHPENQQPWKVLLGHLGRDALQQFGP